MKYNASSPDELALVNFAKFCGIEYAGTDEQDNAIIKINNGSSESEQVIEVLHIFEFDSTRKRQSVVIRDPDTKKIKILTKGNKDYYFNVNKTIFFYFYIFIVYLFFTS